MFPAIVMMRTFCMLLINSASGLPRIAHKQTLRTISHHWQILVRSTPRQQPSLVRGVLFGIAALRWRVATGK